MTANTVYQLKTDGISAEDFGGELVAVNFTNGKYYGLAGAAPMIWSLLETARSVENITTEVCRRTGAPEQEVQASITTFLQQLQNEDLVSVDAEGDAPNQAPAEHGTSGGEQEFKAPELTVYSDLQELIMLDPVHDADPDHGWPVRREDHLDNK